MCPSRPIWCWRIGRWHVQFPYMKVQVVSINKLILGDAHLFEHCWRLVCDGSVLHGGLRMLWRPKQSLRKDLIFKKKIKNALLDFWVGNEVSLLFSDHKYFSKQKGVNSCYCPSCFPHCKPLCFGAEDLGYWMTRFKMGWLTAWFI